MHPKGMALRMAPYSESREGIWTAVLKDGGPLYAETHFDRLIAEPFNAVSAFIFLIIAIRWAWLIRGHAREHLFFAFCIGLLAVGGVGGTLYHGTRSSSIFHLMDILAIAFICVAVGAYLWGRLLRRRGWWAPAVVVMPMLLPLPWAYWKLPNQVAVSFSYLVFSGVIIVPLAVTLKRTHCRHGAYVAGALALFLVALIFRILDSFAMTLLWLPMGSHWLWHVFSAGAVSLLLQYFYEFSQSRS